MSTPAASSGPVVLVVDDDLDFLATVHYMLEQRGFQVLTASDADAALAICRDRGGAVDVVLADLSLPGDLSGTLAPRIAADHPDIKVIFVTGVPRYIAVASGLVRPDAPYLEKPVNPDVLSGQIRSVLTPPSPSRGRS